MSNQILVWVEQFKGQAASASWEATSLARTLADQLGGQVIACVLGQGIGGLAQEAITFGADQALVCDDATVADFRPEPYVALLTKLVKEYDPAALLMTASARGRDLAGGLAAELGVGVIADCTAFRLDGDKFVATRPIYAGKLLSDVTATMRPVIVTIRNRAFPKPDPDTSRSGQVTNVPPVLAEDAIVGKVMEWVTEEGKVNLADAKVIVSGGRGVGGPDGFKPVRDLAVVLGAAVGASRAAVDAGWIPYAHQVGQTGKTVSPDMYIACGISGSIQHQAGMRTAKVIVAINKDPEAPVYKLARYGVVGDLFQIVPALTEEFRKRLGK
jgi:electron transfer flavoprotein alpha subunit